METDKIEFIDGGTVTSPKGFFAGAAKAGIKEGTDKLDLGILFSETPCASAGVFTRTRITSAPVSLCQDRIKEGKVVAVVANSGCANAYTGEEGKADAIRMAELTAQGIGVDPEQVLMASTGVTGQLLPMDRIEYGISQVILSAEGGHDLAQAIMTTDTVPKEAAVSAKGDGFDFTIGGVAKGSGMIHPDMATMFCFLTTDAPVRPDFLQTALNEAMAVSLNMISIDGDTSPSDTVVLMANGQAGGELISEGSARAETFQATLNKVCIFLAKALARDGEGATRLIEVTITRAASIEQARTGARAVTASNLVKTAVYGADPNWGRIIMA